MIDSIVLNLSNDQFELKMDNKLDGKKTQKGRGFSISSSYCNEYNKNLKKQGAYCLEVTKTMKNNHIGEVKEILEIQVSLPKLLYGSNLFEVDSCDLDKIYYRLLSKLENLGVMTTKEQLQKAVIKRADFSKIIRLSERFGEANWVVERLSKFDYKPRSDYNFHKFNDGNDGRCVKFWNSTQGFVIYDVIGNILSNGYTRTEIIIKQAFKEGKAKRTALRFELSLERKDSFDSVIRNRLTNLDKKRDFCLEDIFREDLSRDILLNTFDKIFNPMALGLIALSEMEENILRMYLDSAGLSVKKQEKLYFWVRMTTNFGISGTWEQIGLKYSGGSIATCKKEILLILAELPKIDGNIPNLIHFLRMELEKFEIIKPRKIVSLSTIIK